VPRASPSRASTSWDSAAPSPPQRAAAAKGALATGRALGILRRARADVAVGTVAMSASRWRWRRPCSAFLSLHEPTPSPAIANRLAGQWAAAVAVSFRARSAGRGGSGHDDGKPHPPGGGDPGPLRPPHRGLMTTSGWRPVPARCSSSREPGRRASTRRPSAYQRCGPTSASSAPPGRAERSSPRPRRAFEIFACRRTGSSGASSGRPTGWISLTPWRILALCRPEPHPGSRSASPPCLRSSSRIPTPPPTISGANTQPLVDSKAVVLLARHADCTAGSGGRVGR